MASPVEKKYISDSDSKTAGVPNEMWREIGSESERAYLLKSETMKRRLLEAKERQGGTSLEEARAGLDV